MSSTGSHHHSTTHGARAHIAHIVHRPQVHSRAQPRAQERRSEHRTCPPGDARGLEWLVAHHGAKPIHCWPAGAVHRKLYCSLSAGVHRAPSGGGHRGPRKRAGACLLGQGVCGIPVRGRGGQWSSPASHHAGAGDYPWPWPCRHTPMYVLLHTRLSMHASQALQCRYKLYSAATSFPMGSLALIGTNAATSSRRDSIRRERNPPCVSAFLRHFWPRYDRYLDENIGKRKGREKENAAKDGVPRKPKG